MTGYSHLSGDPGFDSELNLAYQSGRRDAYSAIHEILNGQEWGADTLESIADLVRSEGFEIEEPENA